MTKKEKYYRILVIIWSIVSLWAAFTHSLFPMIISNSWNWGFDKGMQSEIAIWNIGYLVITIQAFRMNAMISKLIVPGIVTLSTLFALNHAAFSNWNGVLLNLPPLIVALGIALFIKD